MPHFKAKIRFLASVSVSVCSVSDCVLVDGVAQWLERRSVAGGLSLIYA